MKFYWLCGTIFRSGYYILSKDYDVATIVKEY